MVRTSTVRGRCCTIIALLMFAAWWAAPGAMAQTGACCIGTSCTIRTLAACDDAGGDFFGGPCSPNPCIPEGACCDRSTLGCTFTTSSDCSSLGRTYLGNDIPCSPSNPCLNLGACCSVSSGACQLTLASGCAAAFQGAGTTCTVGRCTGACCDSATLSCAIRSPGACPSSGAYLGNTTTCSPNSCPAQAGACCDDPDGVCRVSLQAGCTASQAFQGLGVACTPGRCVGACCQGDSCTVVHRSACPSATSYAGDGTTCQPDTCTLGACCMLQLGGICSLTIEAECVRTFRTFVGFGAPCTPNPCQGACCSGVTCNMRSPLNCVPPAVYQGDGTVCLPCNPCITEPVGACCRSSACTVEVEVCCDNGVFQGAGTACAPGACVGACCDGAACTLTDGAACAAGGGIYHGNGTSCGTDPGNLTTCCPANFNGVGGVSVQDIFDFLSAYFAGQFTADFNHSMSITVQDIFDFLAAYFAGCT